MVVRETMLTALSELPFATCRFSGFSPVFIKIVFSLAEKSIFGYASITWSVISVFMTVCTQVSKGVVRSSSTLVSGIFVNRTCPCIKVHLVMRTGAIG